MINQHAIHQINSDQYQLRCPPTERVEAVLSYRRWRRVSAPEQLQTVHPYRRWGIPRLPDARRARRRRHSGLSSARFDDAIGSMAVLMHLCLIQGVDDECAQMMTDQTRG